MVVNLFVENAVSPEGLSGGFAANFFFKKKAKLSNQVVSVDNVLQCLCSSVPLCWKQEESRGYEGEEVTSWVWPSKTRRKRQRFIAIGAVLADRQRLSTKQGNLAVLNWHQVYPLILTTAQVPRIREIILSRKQSDALIQ